MVPFKEGALATLKWGHTQSLEALVTLCHGMIHIGIQQIQPTYILWNGWKVAIVTQRLFQAHVTDVKIVLTMGCDHAIL